MPTTAIQALPRIHANSQTTVTADVEDAPFAQPEIAIAIGVLEKTTLNFPSSEGGKV